MLKLSYRNTSEKNLNKITCDRLDFPFFESPASKIRSNRFAVFYHLWASIILKTYRGDLIWYYGTLKKVIIFKLNNESEISSGTKVKSLIIDKKNAQKLTEKVIQTEFYKDFSFLA